MAYTSRQLKPELVEKLSRDPEYAKMCMYCKNAPQLLAVKALHEVPEGIVLERCCITFEHPMKTWDGIPFIYLGIEPVGEERYGLWVRVPFSRNTDRVMGMMMRSGTRQELIEYMHSAECGPLFMRCLDEINESLRCHD